MEKINILTLNIAFQKYYVIIIKNKYQKMEKYGN